jgi:hypothetical protein
MQRLRYKRQINVGVSARNAVGVKMSSTTVTADAKFLRRVFLGLVALTIFTGSMAALAIAQAIGI